MMERQHYQKTRYTIQDAVNFVLEPGSDSELSELSESSDDENEVGQPKIDCNEEEEITDNEEICGGEDQNISNFESVRKRK
jgi:hypothetical protein